MSSCISQDNNNHITTIVNTVKKRYTDRDHRETRARTSPQPQSLVQLMHIQHVQPPMQNFFSN